MKKTSKALATLLAVVMLFSCVSAVAMAESPEYTQEDFTYVAFGDSYTRGMGCSDTWEADTKLDYSGYDHQSRNVPGAYPYIVAQALGCDTETANGYLDEPDASYWPLIQNGQRIAGVMDLLGIDDGYWDSYFYHDLNRGHGRRYEKLVKCFGNPDSKWRAEDDLYGQFGSVYDARELIKDADLITLQLGMADVMNRPVYAAAQEYLGGDLNFDVDAEVLAAFAAKVLYNIAEGFNYFKEYYPVLLKYISEFNEDGEVMVLSVANPAYGINISNEILVPIGDAFSVISMAMNKLIKQWAEEYGLTYIDISNVDTGAVTNDWTLVEDIMNGGKAEVGTHPSPEGHAQIARQIIRAFEGSDTAKKYEVQLDIGRFDGITSVKVNGKSSTDYTLDGNKLLTVNCKGPLAKALTITYVTPEGKTVTSTYELTWHSSDGYSAYRVYTTNDLSSVVTTAVTATQKAVKSIFGKLFGK